MATKISEKDTMLKQNPKIDKKLVAAHEDLEKELHRLGVDTRTRYTFGIPITEKHRNPVVLITYSRTNSTRSPSQIPK